MKKGSGTHVELGKELFGLLLGSVDVRFRRLLNLGNVLPRVCQPIFAHAWSCLPVGGGSGGWPHLFEPCNIASVG